MIRENDGCQWTLLHSLRRLHFSQTPYPFFAFLFLSSPRARGAFYEEQDKASESHEIVP